MTEGLKLAVVGVAIGGAVAWRAGRFVDPHIIGNAAADDHDIAGNHRRRDLALAVTHQDRRAIDQDAVDQIGGEEGGRGRRPSLDE